MTFNSAEEWDLCQAAKIAPLVVPYLQGTCLDIGSGPGAVWPRLIGIDFAEHQGRPISDLKCDAADLSIFANDSIDGIFSSFMLHQMERSKAVRCIHEWGRILKPGGHMVIYVPICTGTVFDVENNKVIPVAPRRGEAGADPQMMWEIKKGHINTLLDIESHHGWDLLLDETRYRGNEFGILLIARKRTDTRWNEDDYWKHQPEGKRRCLVIRYGAIGDAIVASAILPHLRKQGYHVTFNTTPKVQDVLRHNPYIDDWWVQETDYVPNDALGPYWQRLGERFERIINLSESVEGTLLALPGRLNHGYSDSTRRKLCSHVNYHERTADIAEVPYQFNGSRFYPTPEEIEWAAVERSRRKGTLIVWTINGSSAHKVWPYIHVVIKWLLEQINCYVYLYADAGIGKELQQGIIDCLKEAGADMKRVFGIAGKWSVRESLAFALQADLLVGPETGPLNAMAFEPMPKVLYLSHSTADNLTKHWRNTTTMVPDRKVACYPCHRLHYTWEHCFQDKTTSAAKCAASIKPELMYAAIVKALGAKSKKPSLASVPAV